MTLTAWLLAAALLLLAVLTCGLAAARRRTFEALVALQFAGTLTTITLVCLTVGLQASSYGNVPVVAAVLTWSGTLICVRFLDRSRV